MTKPAFPRPDKPIDWQAPAAGPSAAHEEHQAVEAEKRAIERERLALEDAIRRAIEYGTAEVEPPYQQTRTILANRYLPAICTGLGLLLFHYLCQT